MFLYILQPCPSVPLPLLGHLSGRICVLKTSRSGWCAHARTDLVRRGAQLHASTLDKFTPGQASRRRGRQPFPPPARDHNTMTVSEPASRKRLRGAMGVGVEALAGAGRVVTLAQKRRSRCLNPMCPPAHHSPSRPHAPPYPSFPGASAGAATDAVLYGIDSYKTQLQAGGKVQPRMLFKGVGTVALCGSAP